MKTLNWNLIRKAFYLMMIAMMVATTSACAKKSGKSGVSSRNYRSGSNGYNNPVYNPNTGEYSVQWGAISHGGTQVLRDYMAGADVGSVSTSANANTGIRFRRNGSSIEILVWDDVANSTGEAFWWAPTIKSISGGKNVGRAVVTISDSIGLTIFDGDVRNDGTYVGEVWYNNGQGEKYLGTFQVYADLIFR